MKKRSSLLVGRIVGFFVVIASLFLACDLTVGLGEHVDTTPPTADISYPPSSAIIRDTFLLAGNCNDDKSMNRVEVMIKNLDNPSLTPDYDKVPNIKYAELDASKTKWSINLNNINPETNKYEYLDGKYEVTIIAYDDTNRSSGKISRTFELDNSAPFFVISKPGVVKSDGKTASAYGSNFSIEGTIADDHAVESMSVKIYNEAGDLVGEPLTETSIATAGGSSVTFAKVTEKEDQQNYKKYYYDIYGENSKGTKSFYCTVFISDNAREYKSLENGNGAGPGNTTSEVYLYDKIYSSLMSSKTGLSLSASDLNRIKNGNETNTRASDELKDLVVDTSAAVFDGNGGVDNDANKLCFTLNPEANPTYSVSGLTFDYNKDEEEFQKMSAGQTMTIALNAGLDNTNIDPKTAKVWMLHKNSFADVPKESSMLLEAQKLAAKVKAIEVKEEAEKIINPEYKSVFYTKAEDYGKTVAGIDDWLLLYNNVGYDGSSVSSTALSVTIPAGSVELGNYYVVVVTGYDVDKIEYLQEKVYGFRGESEGVPPTVVVDDFVGGAYFDSTEAQNLKFTGTAILEKQGIYINKFITTIERVNEEDSKDKVSISKTFTRTVKNGVFLDEKGNEASLTNNGFIFNDADGKWTVNPKKFEEYSKVKVNKNTGKLYSYTLNFDAYSSSGHNTLKTCIAHIDTKAPEIEISNITPTVEIRNNEIVEHKINGTIKIEARVSDDNLAKVDYETWVDGNKVETVGYSGTSTEKKAPKFYIDTTKLTDGKEFVFKVIAYDVVGNKTVMTSTDFNNATSYTIDQETDRPTIDLGDIKILNSQNKPFAVADLDGTSNSFSSSNNKMSINVSDDKKLSKIRIYLYDAKTGKLVINSGKDGNSNSNIKTDENGSYFEQSFDKATAKVDYRLPKTEGYYLVGIEVYDETYDFSNESKIENKYRFKKLEKFAIVIDDGTAPTVQNLKSIPETLNKETQNTEFKITVEVKQAFSPIKNVEIYDGTKKLTPKKSETPVYDKTTGIYTYAFVLDKADLGSGSHNYIIHAMDIAGNENKDVSISRYFDYEVPTVTIGGVSPTANVNDVEYINGKIKISGTAEDEKLLFNKDNTGLTWKIVDTTDTTVLNGTLKLEGTFKNWNFDIDSTKLTDNETYKVQVSVKDDAGNTSAIAEREIKVKQSTDTPVISLTTANTSVNDWDLVGGLFPNILSTTGKLSGSISDDDGIKSVKVIVYKEDGTTVIKESEVLKNGTSPNYSINKTLKDLGITAEGGYSIKIVVEDTKNETGTLSSKTTKFNIAVDNSSPTLEIDPYDPPYYSKNFSVDITVKDASDKVSIKAEGSSKNFGTKVIKTGVAGSKTFVDEIIVGNENVTDGYKVSYTATDRWGNSTTKEITYYVDKTAPVFIDDYSGIKVNETTTNGANNIKAKWFNSNALDILGYFTDTDGSGVSEIRYELTKPDGKSATTSKISPAKSDYDLGGATKTTAFRYNSTISGFEECKTIDAETNKYKPYTLTITATDKAGNSFSTTQTILIDQTSPNAKYTYYSYDDGLNSTQVNGSILSNKENDLTLFGTLSDVYSGVASGSSLKVGNSAVAYTVKYTTSTLSDAASYKSATWENYDAEKAKAYTGFKILIAKENLKDGKIDFTSKDNAGNGSEDSVNVVIDTTAPAIAFSDISDADSDTADLLDVNKKLVLSGIASDNRTLKSVEQLKYKVAEWDSVTDKFKAYGDWKTLDKTISGTYSWSVAEIDTTTFADKSKVTFSITAVDTAENSTTIEKELYINQDSDKPVISISSLDGNDAVIANTTLLGTIRDDDGIETFKYSTDGTTYTTENLTLSSGSWKITGLSAGAKTLYFQVKDKAGTTFTTADSSDKPFIVYSDGKTKHDNDAAVSFKIDLTAPTIAKLQIAATKDTTAPTKWDDKLKSFGGDTKYMWIYAEVSEDVDVNTASVNATTATDATVKVGSTSLPSDTGINRDDKKLSAMTYVIGPYDIKDAPEGTQIVTFTVTDKSGRTSEPKTATVYIDKKAPEVEVTSPSIENKKSTDSIVGKTTIQGQISDSSNLAKFYYMIPDSTQKSTITKSSYKFKASDGWTDMTSFKDKDENALNVIKDVSSALWKIPVTETSFTAPASGISLIYYATAKNAAGTALKYATEIEGKTDVYVPLYFYAEDSTGQGKVSYVELLVDPVAGIPSITINAPSAFAKTGGNVNVQGTVTDDASDLDYVTVKIDVSTTEITGDDAAKESAVAAINNWKTVPQTILEKTGVLDTTTGTAQADDTIKAVKASNFKVSVALSAISDADLIKLVGSHKDDDGVTDVPNDIKTVRITTVATDKNGTTNKYQLSSLDNDGDENYTYISVDKNAPQMSNVQLVQYKTDPTSASEVSTAEITLSRAYTAGMYISNGTGNKKWWLRATVTDDAGVQGVKITSGNKYRAIDSKELLCTGVGEKTFVFTVPLDTVVNASKPKTQFYPTIELDDGQHTDVTQNLSIFVDNDAPTLGTSITGNNGTAISESNVVENYDGSFTFSGSVTEAGSGYDFVAYYFMKEDGTIYNPQLATGNTNKKEASAADGKVYINADGLPALYKSTGVTRGTNTVSYTGLGSNKFIKKANLVKVDGAYIRITGITGDEVTLEEKINASGTSAIEFIYAQVVDNNVTESFTKITAENPDGVANDDGDGIVESVKIADTTYKWSSTIYSDRIKDGPITLHYVAFDKAGNHVSGSVDTSVANNRPRIAKVYLATDFNSDGKYNYNCDISGGAVNSIDQDKATENGHEFGELAFYSTLDSEGKVSGTATVKSTDSNFVVSNDLFVMPEIVGGNFDNDGVLKYTYRVADSLDDATITKKTDAASKNVNPYLTGILSGDSLKAKLSAADGSLQSVDSLLGLHEYTDSTNALYKPAEDETPDTKHTGSYVGLVLNKTALSQYESWTAEKGKKTKWFAFTFWDTTAGTTQGESSLFALLRLPIVVNVIDDIAPTATIRPMYWNSKNDSTFCYDDNDQPLGHIDIPTKASDKVGISGQVYIEGYANDESKLKTITVVAPEYNKKAQTFIIAEYVSGKWVTGNDTNEADSELYKKTWNWPENWKDSEILSETLSIRKGHTVNWRVAIDMTKYGLGNGTFGVTASDTKPNASTFDATKVTSTTEANLTSRYDVSFVPYIKSIYPATASSANRSRLGKFPVQAGQPMIIEGMNFAKGASYTVKFYKTKSEATEGDVQGDESADGATGLTGTIAEDGKITVTKAPNHSRYVEVTVGTQKTKNNTNKNSGCNIEAGYNSKKSDKGLADANKAGSNFWTDDRYISVWKVGTAFDKSENPIHGTMENLSVSDYKYLAGEKYGPTGNNKFDGTTLYGVWGGQDNNMWDNMLGLQRAKNVSTGDSGTFGSPAAEVDTCIVNGTVFYGILDDSWVNASTFGFGLTLLRDGHTCTNNVGVVEKIEEDKVRDQFMNPKIAGVYTTSSDSTKGAKSYHMYVSYYDRYSHCLKYGKVEWADTIGKDNNDRIKNITHDGLNAGAQDSAGIVVAGTDLSSDTSDVGLYSDIKVVDNGNKFPTPIIVYYDKGNGCLNFAVGEETDSTAPATWTNTTITNPSNVRDFGRYVTMERDNNGGLHVVAQDASDKGVLYYGYFASGVASAPTGGWKVIDSTDAVGSWTDLKLENMAGNSMITCRPVVTYMNSARINTVGAVKMAYLTADNKWECETVPAIYEAKDVKTSAATGVREADKTISKYAVGYNATVFAVDFLRGE